MARSEHVVIRSACGALIAMLLLYLVTNFAATAVNLINPDITPPESTMIWVAMNLLPTAFGRVAHLWRPGCRLVLCIHVSIAGRLQRQP